MNIGKASKLSDLTVKATRYYANIDLVKPRQDFQTGYRNYTQKDILKETYHILKQTDHVS